MGASPKYLKLKKQLLEEFIRPSSSSRLPTIREIMKHYGVSQATVTSALGELEREGIVLRRNRLGNLVNRKPIIMDAHSKENGHPSIVLAYVDYTAWRLWNQTSITEQYCRQEQIDIVIMKIRRETKIQEVTELVRSQKNCLGLILKTSANKLSEEDLRELGSLKLPVVLEETVFRYPDAPENIYSLLPDGIGGGNIIAELLLHNGHRRIGFIRNEPLYDFTDLIIKSMCWRLKMAGLENGGDFIFSSGIKSWEDSAQAALQVVRRNMAKIRENGITALVFATPSGALAGMRAIQETGLKIPDNISLIACRDCEYTELLFPALTVIDHDFTEMCRLSVDIIRGGNRPRDREIQLPMRLIKRESIRQLN